MKGIGGFVLSIAFVAASGAPAAKAPCPPHEAGAAYPWDIPNLMPGDKHASIFIDVDRTGRPLTCKIGDNNIADPYTRFQLCNAYTQDWKAPPAGPGEADRRTIRRETVMIGSEHELANQKARREWFKTHLDERPACYPE